MLIIIFFVRALLLIFLRALAREFFCLQFPLCRDLVGSCGGPGDLFPRQELMEDINSAYRWW